MKAMYTIDLNNIYSKDLNIVGSKALNCSIMIKKGVLVPDGFSLTDLSFKEFLKHNKLEEVYHDTLHAFNLGLSDAELELYCSQLQEKISNSSLPENVYDEIVKSLNKHNLKYFSVRSSSSVEDMKSYAFAGMFHTELNVTIEKLIPAVLNCWSSFFEYTTLTEILRNNFDPKKMGVSLLVQEMIKADFAGVMFTMDPTGQDENKGLLSITIGTAENLMDGKTSSESLYINRKRKSLQNKINQIKINIDAPSQKLINQLIETGLNLEKDFDHPQDIEWAIKDDRLYFLQIRPITTIEDKYNRKITWTREKTEERYPIAISPLGWSIIEPFLELNVISLSNRFGLKAKHPKYMARTINHQVYSNKKFLEIPASISPKPGSLKEIFISMFKGYPYVLWICVLTLFKKINFGIFWLLLSRFFQVYIFPQAKRILNYWDKSIKKLIEEMDNYNDVDVSKLSLVELWEHRNKMENTCYYFMEPDIAIYIIKMACSWIIEKIGKKVDDKNHLKILTDLTCALKFNKTLDMNVEMREMSEYVNSQPEIIKDLEDENYEKVLDEIKLKNNRLLIKFLNNNGHLTTNWDIMEPTWQDDPKKILQMLRSYIVSKQYKDFSQFQISGQRSFEETRKKVITFFEKSPWMETFFNDVLHYLREFMRIDEEHHFYCSRLFRPMRNSLYEIGIRLKQKNIIEKPDDIFFLHLKEIKEIIENDSAFTRRYLINQRRKSFNQSMANRPPDKYIGQRPVYKDKTVTITKGSLKGIGASPGFASGSVHIITSPKDAKNLKHGDIIVTSSPNPAFTPLYAIASGIITSTGDILSHGFVSAREYHLPAITCISDAPNRFINGQKVKIDGHTGIVSLISS